MLFVHECSGPAEGLTPRSKQGRRDTTGTLSNPLGLPHDAGDAARGSPRRHLAVPTWRRNQQASAPAMQKKRLWLALGLKSLADTAASVYSSSGLLVRRLSVSTSTTVIARFFLQNGISFSGQTSHNPGLQNAWRLDEHTLLGVGGRRSKPICSSLQQHSPSDTMKGSLNTGTHSHECLGSTWKNKLMRVDGASIRAPLLKLISYCYVHW